MRVPKEDGLHSMHGWYQRELPTAFQVSLTILEATELPPNDEGAIGLAIARYGVSLKRDGRAVVTFEIEDMRERTNVQALIEQMEEVDGEYCFVGEVSKIDPIQFATGLAPSELVEAACVLANLLQRMSETILLRKDWFLTLPADVLFAWLREYAFTEKSKPIRQVEHEGVRWFRFDDPMSWSA